MVEHLKIDGVSLATAENQLAQAIGQFNLGNTPTDQVADSVGHARLAESLRKFGSDWSIKREKLSEKLAALESNLQLSIQTFGDWDKGAADSFSSSTSTGQAPKSPTPDVSSPPSGGEPGGFGGGNFSGGGASGGSGRSHPVVPDITEGPDAPRGSVPTPGGEASQGIVSPPSAGSPPDPIGDVVDRLTRAVDGWQSMPPQEQALLFTAIGTAGLTLLVRAGKLPPSVLAMVGSPQRPFPGKPLPPLPHEHPDFRGKDPISEDASSGESSGLEDLIAGPEEKAEHNTDPSTSDTLVPDASAAPSQSGAPPGTEGLETLPVSSMDDIHDTLPTPVSEPDGAGGSCGGGGGALPEVPSIAEDPSTSFQPGAPALSELLDSSIPAREDPETSAPLPPLSASLALAGESTSPEHGGSGRAGMGMGMSAGMGMASMANSLGGVANTASSALNSKADQEAKIKDAVKALNELREESKESQK